MKRHHHSGKSSAKILDYEKIIRLSTIKNAKNIIDIGCGYGDFAVALSRHTDAQKIYAIDIFREGIDELIRRTENENISNITCINEDFTKTNSLPENFFDAAFMINVMHGFYANNEADITIENLNRILRPNAKVIIAEFRKYIPLIGPPVGERISEKELSRIFEKSGYRKLSVKGLGITHYLAIYQKSA